MCCLMIVATFDGIVWLTGIFSFGEGKCKSGTLTVLPYRARARAARIHVVV
jgi:hypothetical protein